VLSLGENLVRNLRADLKRDKDAMYKLSAYDLERLIAELLRDMGYDVYLTPQTHDSGRDILAWITLPPSISLLVVVECKKWSKDRRIDPGVVRQFLFTIREHDRANIGILVTTTYCTSGARLGGAVSLALELARLRRAQGMARAVRKLGAERNRWYLGSVGERTTSRSAMRSLETAQCDKGHLARGGSVGEVAVN